jgi:hypothetical protein
MQLFQHALRRKASIMQCEDMLDAVTGFLGTRPPAFAAVLIGPCWLSISKWAYPGWYAP